MAPHSSILAWRIPWTEEPGGLQSMGSQRVGHGWTDWACTHTLLNNPLLTSVKTCQQKGTSNINLVLFIKVVMLVKGSCPVFCRFTFDHIESSLIFNAISLAISFFKLVLDGKIEGNSHCWAYIWDSKQSPREKLILKAFHTKQQQSANCRLLVSCGQCPQHIRELKSISIFIPSPGAHGFPLNPKDITIAPVMICKEIKKKNSDWRLMWFLMLFKGMYFPNEFSLLRSTIIEESQQKLS